MRRLKKILKYVALTVAALLALALIANAFLVWQTGRRLEERLSKLRAAGEPLSLPELGAAPVPPGRNAADVLQNIQPELQALSKEISVVLAKATADNPRPTPFPDEDRKILEEAFANHPKVLPALREAADCPAYFWPLNYQLPAMEFLGTMPEVQLQRQAAQALDTQCRLQLQRKDRDAAMQTSLVCLRLNRTCDRDPLLISYLVTLAAQTMGLKMANEILQAGPVAPALQQELEAELAKHDNTDGLRRALITERAFSLQSLDELGAGWFTRAWVNDQKCFYLDALAAQIDQTDASYSQFQEAEANAKQAKSLRHVLVDLWLPAAFKVHEATFRTRCMVRCLRVLNALTVKKVSEVPAKLTNIGLPADAVTDPYTGQPLIVKKVDGQWLIYGLGANLKDDGGKLDNYDDVGLGPIKK
jgi:hypothetical protein